MATRLKGLTVDRVDLVDIGANLDKRTGDGAHILLYKRADGTPDATDAQRAAVERIVAFIKSAPLASADMTAKADTLARTFGDVLAGRQAQKALEELWDLYYAFMEAARSIFESDEANKIGLLRASAGDFITAFLSSMPDVLEDAGIEKVGRKISAARMAQLKSMHENLGKILAECEGDTTMKIAEFAKSLGIAVPDGATDDQVKQAVEAHIAKATTEAMPADAIQKRIDEAVAKSRSEIEAAANARIEKAEGIAKAERDARILKGFEEQAQTVFKGLPLSLTKAADKPESKTDAEVFKALSEAAPAEWQRVSEILKGAAEAIRQSALFKEQGSAQADESGSAVAQIFAKADALVKSGVAKTREQGVVEVLADPKNAELAHQYMSETAVH